jgi:hypothetical protein
MLRRSDACPRHGGIFRRRLLQSTGWDPPFWNKGPQQATRYNAKAQIQNCNTHNLSEYGYLGRMAGAKVQRSHAATENRREQDVMLQDARNTAQDRSVDMTARGGAGYIREIRDGGSWTWWSSRARSVRPRTKAAATATARSTRPRVVCGGGGAWTGSTPEERSASRGEGDAGSTMVAAATCEPQGCIMRTQGCRMSRSPSL